MNENKHPFEWIVIGAMNGQTCSICGETMNDFLPQLCSFETYGLFKFGHPEFEAVIQMRPETLTKLLNLLGIAVAAGERFKEGETIHFEGVDDEVHLKEFRCDGQKYLRLIFPDSDGRYPEDAGCKYPFNMQLKNIDELSTKNECNCSRVFIGKTLYQKNKNDDESK